MMEHHFQRTNNRRDAMIAGGKNHTQEAAAIHISHAQKAKETKSKKA